jgi:hypothetical protein
MNQLAAAVVLMSLVLASSIVAGLLEVRQQPERILYPNPASVQPVLHGLAEADL